ncbi:MAG: ion transporter [Blastocatellia bacterium]
MPKTQNSSQPPMWKATLYEVIFEADTKAGRLFDIGLFISISASILILMLESVENIQLTYSHYLSVGEWFFTILFTIEYLLRIICIRRPLKYITSFFGIVDLLAILPNYLFLFIPNIQSLAIVRVLRLLRIFRILKLTPYINESNVLLLALKASRYKISVFLLTILTIVFCVGSLMYVIEGKESGFNNIPTSIYWAIVTLTTVGYGDIAPKTILGRTLASIIMILGYAIIAVPTGIVTVELSEAAKQAKHSTQVCPTCIKEGHAMDAIYCKYCGSRLNPQTLSS